ncbi:MAG: hypothetical protein ACJ76N_13800 [Thermoanaerobaculia bacterium]
MTKSSVRLLRALALVLTTLALGSSAVAAVTCTRETGWHDAAGHPLDCYTCGSGSQQTTYCYPAGGTR